jgi:RNA polymerase sigma-70 factor (ECF subfamily)
MPPLTLELRRVFPFTAATRRPAPIADIRSDQPEDEAARQRAETIRAAAAGDQHAFADLYRDHVRMVHAVLLARVPRAEVDDLVQDVFLTAFTRLSGLREPRAFGGWLAAIARNRATDHLRQAREQVELPPDLPGGEAIETEAIAVLEAVRSLPEAYRETLLMRLVHGMTGVEIAERTGLTEGSVRVNLHRGMKLLREALTT